MRRPEVRPGDFNQPVSTPDFESKTQLYAAMPRDVLIVVSATGCVYWWVAALLFNEEVMHAFSTTRG